jgi:hypothetical protein
VGVFTEGKAVGTITKGEAMGADAVVEAVINK